MAEIHLPTKTTQDAIKQDTSLISSKASQTSVNNIRNDTQYIRGQFPISGGTNFFEGVLTEISPGGSIVGKGLLISIAGRNSTSDREITIDGSVTIEGPIDRTSVTVFAPFSRSVSMQSNASGFALLF